MEWLMEDAIYENSGVSLAKMTLGIDVLSERHTHPNCTETIHLLSGEVEQLIGEKSISMSAGDTCLIPKNHSHQTRNIGDTPAIMMLAYSSVSRVYKAIHD